MVWGDLSVSCLRSADGQPEGFIAQIIDVTSEVEARRTLTHRDEQNRVLTKRLREKSDRLTSELRSAAGYDRLDPARRARQGRYGDLSLPAVPRGWPVTADYRWIDDDHLRLSARDVSGHGIQSALLSVSVHNLSAVRVVAGRRSLLQPERVVEELNDLFLDGRARRQLLHDLVQRACRPTNADLLQPHPPALLLTAEAGAAR